MMTSMIYDLPLEIAWDKASMHNKIGEDGWLTVPLTRTVETEAWYYFVAENTPQLVKTIYAAIEIADYNLTGLRYGYVQKIGDRRYITIPVASAQQADAVFYVWEDSLRNGMGVVAATNFILDKIDQVGY